LLHKKNPPAMLRRWLGGTYANNDEVVRLLAEFVALVEPVKGYTRGRMQKATQQTPLTKLADIAQPDSEAARNFARLVEDFIAVERVGDSRLSQLVTTVVNWSKLNGTIRGMDLAASAPNVNEALPLLQNLMAVSNVGLDALSALERQTIPSPEWRAEKLAVLETAAKPSAAVELMVTQPIKELVIAAAEQEKRKTMSAEEWKKMVKEMAAPKRR